MPWTPPPPRQPGFWSDDLGDNMPPGLRTKGRKQAPVECANVRDGSFADLRRPPPNVWFTLDSRHQADIAEGPPRARSGSDQVYCCRLTSPPCRARRCDTG